MARVVGPSRLRFDRRARSGENIVELGGVMNCNSDIHGIWVVRARVSCTCTTDKVSLNSGIASNSSSLRSIPRKEGLSIAHLRTGGL